MQEQINDLQRGSASGEEGTTVENYKGRACLYFWLERAETQLALSHAWRVLSGARSADMDSTEL